METTAHQCYHRHLAFCRAFFAPSAKHIHSRPHHDLPHVCSAMFISHRTLRRVSAFIAPIEKHQNPKFFCVTNTKKTMAEKVSDEKSQLIKTTPNETKKKEETLKNLPSPLPPEKPLPGDCCGSGCVRCVWDVYYEELEEYNKLYNSDSKGSRDL